MQNWLTLAMWSSFISVLALSQSAAEDLQPSLRERPEFKQLRYDEDYRFLAETTNDREFLDPLKFIRLNDAGTAYLTLGGEIRQRYEYFENPLWGSAPQDPNGYLLQRYMLH